MASSILANVMLDQRHKAAMKDLEKEMQLEMAKQREELNRELEDELKLELEVCQRKPAKKSHIFLFIFM